MGIPDLYIVAKHIVKSDFQGGNLGAFALPFQHFIQVPFTRSQEVPSVHPIRYCTPSAMTPPLLSKTGASGMERRLNQVSNFFGIQKTFAALSLSALSDCLDK